MQVLDKNGNEVRIGDTVEFKSWAGGRKTPILKEGLVINIHLYNWWREKNLRLVKLSVLAENNLGNWVGKYIATISNLNNIRVINF